LIGKGAIFMKHPMQPIDLVDDVYRFRKNTIVRFLLDNGRYNLNDIIMMDNFDEDDYIQLMQLIGYSVYGFLDLSASRERNESKWDEAHEEARKNLPIEEEIYGYA